MAIEHVIVVLLAITLGTLGAIVYSLRILLLLERRIARIDFNIERLVERVLREEERIEKEEERIEREEERIEQYILGKPKKTTRAASKRKAKKAKKKR